MKAMILAAGLGARLKTLTSSTPKALIKIKQRTLLEILINRLKSFGVDQIIINVHYLAGQIITYLENNNYFDIHIEISMEKELLDTGGGLKKAGWFFDDGKPFLVHNVDVLCDINYDEFYGRHLNNNCLATLAARQRKTNRYLLCDEQHYLCGWQSEQTGEKRITRHANGSLFPVSFTGIHVISPELLSLLPAENKFSIIEAYLQIAEENLIKIDLTDAGRWLDVGRPQHLQQAEKLFPEYF
ncbi:MAG: sugar phosphate nucleotidyltransferase [Calditrichaceae bacterium]|jgi:NDP-sugar pyrophosphorylase family protein